MTTATLHLDLERLGKKLFAATVAVPSGCHLWTGYIQPNGYGYVNLSKTKIPAHRLALLLAGVAIPQGMDVCHRCDVRNCVNPNHLYVGTRRDNMRDCTARGRHNKPLGQNHWCAKLSDLQIQLIRSLRLEGATTTSLASRFNINPGTISRICRREWRKEVA